MQDNTKIEFLKPFQAYQPGDHASLPKNGADYCISQGIARAISDAASSTPLSAIEVTHKSAEFSAKIEMLDDYLGARKGEQHICATEEAARLVENGKARFVEPNSKEPGTATGEARGNAPPQRKRSQWDGSFAKFLYVINLKDRIKGKKILEEDFGSEYIEQKAAMGSSSGAIGGYTIPSQFAQEIQGVIWENSIFRPRAMIQPMTAETVQVPYLDVTTAQSAGVSPFFGGVQMYWTPESKTRTETEPSFKQLQLKANELSGYVLGSRPIFDDGMSGEGLETFLYTLFGRSVAWFEDYAFFQGDGVARPQGIIGANVSVSVTRQAANQIQFADVATMFSKLIPYSWTNAVWAFHPSALPQLLQLKDGTGRAVFLSVCDPIWQRPSFSLLGRQAIPTEKLPALGTKGDLCLLDPSLYCIGDRGLLIAPSEHANFLTNQMTWRIVQRVDGQPWIDKPITLADGSTTASGFIILN